MAAVWSASGGCWNTSAITCSSSPVDGKGYFSLSSIFIIYTGASIAQVFFITAATFLAMSLYGYTTRSDLTRFGSFLFMGLIGIVIASLVNIFVRSSAVQFVISIIRSSA